MATSFTCCLHDDAIFFFAAGHHNYATYGTYYLYDMKKLPQSIFDKFLQGEHTTRHNGGLWNGIWSDMFIKTSFMRYGKGPGGLIGLTLNEKSGENMGLQSSHS